VLHFDFVAWCKAPETENCEGCQKMLVESGQLSNALNRMR
jgi:hypothetical protein